MTDEELYQHIDSKLDRIYDFNIDFYHRYWESISDDLRAKLYVDILFKIAGNTKVIPRQPTCYKWTMKINEVGNNL
jgi:hypothetical protein